MEIVKIVGIAIITTISFLVVKQTKTEFAPLVLIVGGVLLLMFAINYIEEILGAFTSILDKTGLSANIFKICLKIVGVGYLTEYTASICNDAGCQSISEKVLLVGKLMILFISLPIITNIIDILVEILP